MLQPPGIETINILSSGSSLSVGLIECMRKLPYREVQNWLSECGSLKFRAQGLALGLSDATELYGNPIIRPNLLRITQCDGGRGAYVEAIGGARKVKLSTFLKRAGSGTKQPSTFRIEPEDPEGTMQAFFDANENAGGPFCVEYAQNFTPRQFTRIKGIHNFRNLMGVFDHHLAPYTIENDNINQSGFAANTHSAVFALHREEACMWSLNGSVYGAPRIWGLIHKRWDSKLIELGREIFGELFPTDCPTPFSHLRFMISPDALRDAGIPVSYVTQFPGDFVVTYDSFHFGINTGAAFAIAAQVSGYDWLSLDYDPMLKCPTNDGQHHDTLQLSAAENRFFSDVLRLERKRIVDAERKRKTYELNRGEKILRVLDYYEANREKLLASRREKHWLRRHEINSSRRVKYEKKKYLRG